MRKKKVLVVFGTRPEVIKLAPIVFAMQRSKSLEVVTCATAQHRELLDQPLEFFRITPDFDLDLMRHSSDLFEITAHGLLKLRDVYTQVKPDLVVVQGDTATAACAALAAFYAKTMLAHIEAGLRTWNKHSPFPEEMNRRMISCMADLHFAPTAQAEENLRKENVAPENLFRTGNTGVDALLWARPRATPVPAIEAARKNKKLILLTVHRRENFGKPMEAIFAALAEFLSERKDFHVVYPVHPNQKGKDSAALASAIKEISTVEPLNYGEMVHVLGQCHLVLTDSGGLQEEAPSLGKPVLILRDTTERPETVTAGCARLVGTDHAKILEQLRRLADPKAADYLKMVKSSSPFGDGSAATQIVDILEKRLSPPTKQKGVA